MPQEGKQTEELTRPKPCTQELDVKVIPAFRLQIGLA